LEELEGRTRKNEKDATSWDSTLESLWSLRKKFSNPGALASGNNEPKQHLIGVVVVLCLACRAGDGMQ
jgi:hypothetical protein